MLKIIIFLGCQERTSLDCSEVWGGEAYIDICGYCVGGNTDELACVQDCNGIFGGRALVDCLSNCSVVGDSDNDAYLGYDPNLMFKSDQTLGDIYINTDTLGYDCSGECNGTCTECDCNGICDGTAVVDGCGVCDTDLENNCSSDCADLKQEWETKYILYSDDISDDTNHSNYFTLVCEIIDLGGCTFLFTSEEHYEIIVIDESYLDNFNCESY